MRIERCGERDLLLRYYTRAALLSTQAHRGSNRTSLRYPAMHHGDRNAVMVTAAPAR